MALSREEARSVGKKIAGEVVKSAQACRCGLAVWDTRTNIASIEAVILHQQADWLQPISRLQQDTLTIVERDCGVDMTKAKELSARLENDIKKRNWQEARADLVFLRGAIQGRFVECAAEGSNPGGQHVTIEDPGKTTFKPGEVISKEAFDKENERVRKLGEKPATEGGESRVVHHSDTIHCHLKPFITGEWKLEKSKWNGKEWIAEPDRYFKSAEEAYKVFNKEC